jgi:hypothetical protein
MLLQSGAIELAHPRSGNPLKIVAPPDPDFEKCFANLAELIAQPA